LIKNVILEGGIYLSRTGGEFYERYSPKINLFRAGLHTNISQFDTMYVILNKNGLGSMNKEQFENVYKYSADNSGKLKNFTIKQTTPNQEGMIVKVALAFFKEKPPVLVNGDFNFHLKMDGGMWKIQAVVTPVKVPGAQKRGKAGGHPGE
jgi:hypothetical protein